MKIKVPTNINDIPLEEYQRFSKVNIEGADQEFLLHKTIEIFCEMDIRDVALLPLKTAQDLYEEINTVLEQSSTFSRRMTIDGVEYGFIPDLESMTLGEYIDLEDGLKDVSQFHKAAAAMYRPIVKQYKELYTIEPYTASLSAHEAMKKAPLGEISAAVVFFWRIVSELSQVTPHYSKALVKETLTTLEKDSSHLNTDGLIAYTRLLTEMQPNTDK